MGTNKKNSNSFCSLKHQLAGASGQSIKIAPFSIEICVLFICHFLSCPAMASARKTNDPIQAKRIPWQPIYSPLLFPY